MQSDSLHQTSHFGGVSLRSDNLRHKFDLLVDQSNREFFLSRLVSADKRGRFASDDLSSSIAWVVREESDGDGKDQNMVVYDRGVSHPRL